MSPFPIQEQQQPRIDKTPNPIANPVPATKKGRASVPNKHCCKDTSQKWYTLLFTLSIFNHETVVNSTRPIRVGHTIQITCTMRWE